MKAGKVWGTTTLVRKSELIEIHYLVINPNSQCSLHKHQYKTNGFMVQSGTLTISVEKNDYALVDNTVLGPGDYMEVRPNEYHRFISHGEVVLAWELYFPEGLTSDIIRKDCCSVLAAIAEA